MFARRRRPTEIAMTMTEQIKNTQEGRGGGGGRGGGRGEAACYLWSWR